MNTTDNAQQGQQGYSSATSTAESGIYDTPFTTSGMNLGGTNFELPTTSILLIAGAIITGIIIYKKVL